MTYHDAIALIDSPWLHSLTAPTHWADLGCGSGVFTLALADLLAPGSTIEAIDLNPTIAAQTTPRGVTIIPRTADITQISLTRSTGPTAAAPTHPGVPFDGILMANSLHYVHDKQAFLQRLKDVPLILVEYDTDKPVTHWVPYPLSHASASLLFHSIGWISFEKLATHPSSFGGSNLYSALALPEAAQHERRRDPSTISPSAYALLLMKGHTSIPYAREAAALMQQQLAAANNAANNPAVGNIAATSPAPGHPPASAPAQSTAPGASPVPAQIPNFGASPFEYWTRVMHFESRYWSIDQLLGDLTATNIMEISSGFSFRGLALSRQKPVYYIDTDLPNIIAGKQKFIDAFTANAPRATPGHYELLPLNALDPIAFEAVINRFPPGPITIVNEGLLVYLSPAEKEQLCRNILTALRTRGGHWITADIYLRRKDDDPFKEKSASWRQWEQEHHLEEKKFLSFHDAETFFQRMGFKKDKEATPDYSWLTSLSKLIAAAGPEAIENLKRAGRNRMHATWRLTPRR